MHNQEPKDEQSSDSINSRVMGTRHFTASNSTVSTSAEMLNLRDLRSAASLDRALARIQVLEDQQRESENFFQKQGTHKYRKKIHLRKLQIVFYRLSKYRNRVYSRTSK
jgi:hypothetical protein